MTKLRTKERETGVGRIGLGFCTCERGVSGGRNLFADHTLRAAKILTIRSNLLPE